MGKTVFGEGPVPATICVLGESPGRWEDRIGRPFMGDSGEILAEWVFGRVLPPREDVYITNVVKTKPKGTSPSKAEIAHWMPVLYDELQRVQPSIVVALGGAAIRVFLPEADVETVHGLPHVVSFLRRTITVLPCYHPAAGLHDPSRLACFWEDLAAVDAFRKGTLQPWTARPWSAGWRVAQTCADLDHVLSGHMDWYVDTEGSVEEPWGLTVCAAGQGDALAVPAHRTDLLAWIHQTLNRSDPCLTFHYALHDLHVLHAMGIDVRWYDDTMLMAYQLQTLPQRLKALAYRLCGLPMQEFSEIPAAVRLSWDPAFVEYACKDALATRAVFEQLNPLVREAGLMPVHDLDLRTLPLIFRMEQAGLPFDRERLSQVYGDLLTTIKTTTADLQQLAARKAMPGFNPRSHPQVGKLLFNRLRLPSTRKTPTGKPATDEAALAQLHAHPAVKTLRTLREAEKMKSTYVEPIFAALTAADRFHDTFKYSRTITGRLAATIVLLIPKHSVWGKAIRRCVRAAPGRVIGSWDLNQIEMRVMAVLSQDEALCRAYRENQDIHAQTAQTIFGVPAAQQDESLHRLPAKTTGFLTIMGGTAKGLLDQIHTYATSLADEVAQQTLLAWTTEDTQRFLDGWFATYPGTLAFRTQCIADATDTGCAVEILSGRIFKLPGIWCPIAKVRAEAERQSYALRFQSGAQTLMKRAMAVVIRRELPEAWRLGYFIEPLLQFHDDLLFELDQAAVPYWHARMQHVFAVDAPTEEFTLPVKVKGAVGPSWGELEEVR